MKARRTDGVLSKVASKKAALRGESIYKADVSLSLFLIDRMRYNVLVSFLLIIFVLVDIGSDKIGPELVFQEGSGSGM